MFIGKTQNAKLFNCKAITSSEAPDLKAQNHSVKLKSYQKISN
jgi:hypothetical protein